MNGPCESVIIEFIKISVVISTVADINTIDDIYL
jgi:hypothetical protein